MLSENIFVGATVATLISALVGFFGALWWMHRRAKNDPHFSQPYPFNNPGFIHVGINPAQAEALKPLDAELRFMRWIPRHDNELISATFYAMTREEFISFFGTLSKHVRILIADAARKEETFLRGEAFTLYDMLIGLTEIRMRIDPTPLASDLVLPLQSSVDTSPAPA